MKRKILFSMFLLVMTVAGFAQTATTGNGITYQAVILKPHGQELPGQNNNNAPLANTPVCLKFSIIDSQSQIEYQETAQVNTDKFGMVNLLIGLQNQVGGYAAKFSGINWGNSGKKLRVELDTNGNCSSFVLVSEAPFGAVPYALSSGSASIADGSITNAKIQSVDASKITGIVPISHGGTGADNAFDARKNIGLGNVDNTADKDKPVSIATQNALNGKENAVNKQNTLAVDGSGVKFPTVDAVNSGLTLKANQTDLDALNSNLTQQINNIGTTVSTGKEDKPNKQNSLAIDGTGTKYPTVDAVNAANNLKADKTYVDSQDALKAPLASPALTGTPTAPTAANGDNSTQIATTQFVTNAVAGATIPDASTTVKGKVKLATLAETQEGLDDTKAITPANLKLITDNVVHLAGAETIAGDKNFIGNTKTANLTLGHDPVAKMDAATKQYVDTSVASASLYQGTFDAVSGNDSKGQALIVPAADNKGYTYICTAAGTLPAPCNIGDHIVSNGTSWDVIPASTFILTSQAKESGILSNLGFTAETNQQAINNAINNEMVNITGNQTITGNKNFTGTVTAPTAASGTSTTQVATTKFVTDAITANNTSVLEDAITNGVTDKAPTENAVFDALATKADQTALTQEITDRTAADALKADKTALTQEITDRTAADALKADKTNGASQITDSNAYATLGTAASATQQTINAAINTNLGTKADKTNGAVQITDPTAYTKIGTAANATQAAINTAVDAKLGTVATDANVVHLTGDETIAGNKTFTGNNIINGNTTINNLTLGHDPIANMEGATKQYVDTQDASKAPLASPALTGVPTAPTAAALDNSTQIATTAFVTTALAANIENAITSGVTTKAPTEDVVYNALAAKAPLASPDLTGVPTAPTAAAGTNTTQLATTAFVKAAISSTTNTITNPVNTITTTVNGVAATTQAVNTVANSVTGSQLTTTVNGVASTSVDLAPAIAAGTTNTITNPVNTITTTVNGVAATTQAVNTVANSVSGSLLTTTVNGVASTSVDLAPALAAATTVSNTSSSNNLTTTVNGVTGAAVNIVNSNTLTAPNGQLTSTVNGVASSPTVQVMVNANNGVTPSNGVVQLGGVLIQPTTVTTTAANTLAIAGLQSSVLATDNVVVTDASTGVLKTVSQASLANDWKLGGNTNGALKNLGTADANDLPIVTNNTERMRVTSTGNVGIGAAAATEKLEVNGTVKANNYISPVQDVTVTGGAWDLSKGSNATWTLAANGNTLTITNAKAGMYGSIIVTNTGGTSTINFASGNTYNKVINGGGGSPALTPVNGAVDILTFFYDGNKFWWTVGNNYN